MPPSKTFPAIWAGQGREEPRLTLTGYRSDLEHDAHLGATGDRHFSSCGQLHPGLLASRFKPRTLFVVNEALH